MRPFWLFVVFTAVEIVNGAVTARADFDVSPRAAGGRVTTPGFDDDAVVLTPNPQRVFDFAFDDPLDPNFTQDPGFHALSTGFAASNGLLASGLTNGDKLTFDVLSGLQYWNGAGAVSIGNVPAGETLQLALGSASRTIGTGTGSFAGFIIGTIGNANDGDQGLHVHLGSTLVGGTNPQPANGVYLFEMDLRMLGTDGVTPDPNIGTSLTFYVLYDHGAPDGAIDTAVAYAQTLVPEPSGFVLAGMGGVLVCGASLCRGHGKRRTMA
jgi:hypothetical protein